MSPLSQNLTVCILAKNEESRIVRALSSVARLGAKALVVDSFSTDETFSVARTTWAEEAKDILDFEFISQEWLGFVRTRESSMKLIKTRWVLWLDSDEWIEDDMHHWLLAHLEYLNPDNVYSFRRQSFFMDKKIRYGGWYPDYKARLCRVAHATWVSGPRGAQVHEDLMPISAQGKSVKIDAHIGHLPFRSLNEQRETNEAYSELLAIGLCESWEAKSCEPFLKNHQQLKVAIKFVENYFWKLGFLDGKAGFRIAVGSAWSLKRRIEKARDLYWTKRA